MAKIVSTTEAKAIKASDLFNKPYAIKYLLELTFVNDKTNTFKGQQCKKYQF